MTSPHIDHGTTAGYQQHRRLGVPMCEPCQQARSDYARSHRRRQRKTTRTLVPVDLVTYLRQQYPNDIVIRALTQDVA